MGVLHYLSEKPAFLLGPVSLKRGAELRPVIPEKGTMTRLGVDGFLARLSAAIVGTAGLCSLLVSPVLLSPFPYLKLKEKSGES